MTIVCDFCNQPVVEVETHLGPQWQHAHGLFGCANADSIAQVAGFTDPARTWAYWDDRWAKAVAAWRGEQPEERRGATEAIDDPTGTPDARWQDTLATRGWRES